MNLLGPQPDLAPAANVRYTLRLGLFGHAMELVYAFVLVVVLSIEPGSDETVLYSFPTWEKCKAKETELISGMQGRAKSENITIDCRRNVRLNLGSR